MEIQLLYAYNRWANMRLLAAAATLPDELLLQDLGGSYVSILTTLRHIAWGEWLWLARWRQGQPAGLDPLQCAGLGELRSRWREIQSEQLEFISLIAPQDLECAIAYENPAGTVWTYTLRHMLQHLVNHSTYHRGQVAVLLRQVGAAPPATDFLVYLDELQRDSGCATASR